MARISDRICVLGSLAGHQGEKADEPIKPRADLTIKKPLNAFAISMAFFIYVMILLDEDVLQNEKYSKDCHCRRYLLELTCNDVHKYISDHSEEDTVRN